MYRNLSDVAVGPLNTDIYILEVPVAETIYYVLFSALVNSTLLIVGRTMFTGQPGKKVLRYFSGQIHVYIVTQTLSLVFQVGALL